MGEAEVTIYTRWRHVMARNISFRCQPSFAKMCGSNAVTLFSQNPLKKVKKLKLKLSAFFIPTKSSIFKARANGLRDSVITSKLLEMLKRVQIPVIVMILQKMMICLLIPTTICHNVRMNLPNRVTVVTAKVQQRLKMNKLIWI